MNNYIGAFSRVSVKSLFIRVSIKSSFQHYPSIDWCKERLTTLLAGDISSFFSSNETVLEGAMLAAKIRDDVTLNAKQVAELKLVDELPLACLQ